MKTLLTALALAAVFATSIVIAADPPPKVSTFAPLAPGERERLLEDARARNARAQALRSEADDEFRRREAACYDKVMVSGCIGDAKQERLRKTLEARQLDVSADRLQREVRLRENAQREAQSADKLPENEAAARSSEEAQMRATEQAERDAERERDLQEAPARAAAEAAKRRKSAEDAARRQSAEAERASKRAASAAEQRTEIDRKAAAHAKRRAEAEAAAAATAGGGSPAPR
ncbi:MAG: hypothetical protein IPJ21_03000 [Sterolibacteriaceae bacterium]|nr:hypothetical protein [Sterolibacteriaceae bacterium]MBK9086626.1 hypothetical protein [Sterolibacteriaceae bacterium]